MSSVSEKDWKLFRKLQVELTSKACDLVFKKVENITNNRVGKEHLDGTILNDLQMVKSIKA